MKTLLANRKYFVLILVVILMGFGIQSSYGQTITASVQQPLTEANLHGSVVTLTLSGGTYERSSFRIENAVTLSGIDAVFFLFSVDRVSDTVVTIELEFYGNIDADGTLTFIVGADAIANYTGSTLTATVPVTAMQESLVASTEFPLTEATLNESIVTLTLSGRNYARSSWEIERALTVSGIDGITVSNFPGVDRISDTEVTVELEFDGTDFDTDATLNFSVGSGAIESGYDQAFTAELSVTAIQKSNATVSISPASVVSPDVGGELTFSINIAGGENVAGYQVTVSFESATLQPIVSFDSIASFDSTTFYVSFTNGDYLPAGAFFAGPIVVDDWLGDTSLGEPIFSTKVILAANTLAGAANGDGTLATLTFQVGDFKPSTLTLSQVYLVDSDGKRWEVTMESAAVTIPPEPEEEVVGDINRDGVVDILDLTIVGARFGQRGQNSADLNGDGLVDIVDLVLVASEFGDEAAAPSLYPQALELLNAADVRQWLSQAQQLALTDPTYLRGITVLEQLHAALIPQETVLLHNYPNPFNPETWIPYRLAQDAFVTLTIYDQSGQIVRTLDVGHQIAGYYTDRMKAAYWDGKNEFGEGVASGVYFYHLSAGDYSATRKMLILK